MFLPFTARTVLVSVGLLAGCAPCSRACGPDFPNAYLANSQAELSSLPTLSFERELERVLDKPRPPRPAPEELARSHADAERAEVRQALAQQGVAAAELDGLVATYDRLNPPRALPAEFHRYAEGARAWREGHADAAVAAWRSLLDLPPRERHFRTVWAAYMIGRALADSDPAAARHACRLVQEAVAAGFADSQELATDALGWDARASWREQDYASALRSYLRQFALGEPSALPSLQLTLQRVFRRTGDDWLQAVNAAKPRAPGDPDGDAHEPAPSWVLESLAEDPTLRQVVTAWFGSRGGPALAWDDDASPFARWLRCLPAIKNLAPDEADRWGWAAYQSGLWEQAGQLAARAPANAPASEWVRGMLLLRAGFIDDAAAHLAAAARAFATDPALAAVRAEGDDGARVELQPLRDAPDDQLGGVRGVLALRREQYTEALSLFLAAKHWDDAAYVAERVLTLDELIAFVRLLPPDESGAVGTPPPTPDPTNGNLRHLLARRLVRAGRFEEAKAYFPKTVAGDFQRYLDAMRSGFDGNEPTRHRGEALWLAAQLERENGMEFRGTELAPDFANNGGNFEFPDLAETRLRRAGRVSDASGAGGDTVDRGDDPLQPTRDELDRLKQSRVPTRRFHYRYRAAELAWLAAGLLPNDDSLTATVLNTAGRWLAARDPEQARLYYQALVLRCPHTDLGRQAATKRWFVDPPNDGGATACAE